MVDQGVHVLHDCREVSVGDLLLLTVLPDYRGNLVVVAVVDVDSVTGASVSVSVVVVVPMIVGDSAVFICVCGADDKTISSNC